MCLLGTPQGCPGHTSADCSRHAGPQRPRRAPLCTDILRPVRCPTRTAAPPGNSWAVQSRKPPVLGSSRSSESSWAPSKVYPATPTSRAPRKHSTSSSPSLAPWRVFACGEESLPPRGQPCGLSQKHPELHANPLPTPPPSNPDLSDWGCCRARAVCGGALPGENGNRGYREPLTPLGCPWLHPDNGKLRTLGGELGKPLEARPRSGEDRAWVGQPSTPASLGPEAGAHTPLPAQNSSLFPGGADRLTPTSQPRSASLQLFLLSGPGRKASALQL